MVFVAGPRQVGKTTLAKSVPGALPGYLNWDVRSDRERIFRVRPVLDDGSLSEAAMTSPRLAGRVVVCRVPL